VTVFVPLHRRRSSSRCAQATRPVRAGAVLAAVLAAIVTGLAGTLFSKKPSDSGDYVVFGVVIAIVAVGCGVAIAKSIGRQGRI
jgi:ABC-type uncharacterized transport system permease subunit